MPLINRISYIVLICILASACATSRGIVDLQFQDLPNPSSTIAVKIVQVTDSRIFEIKPKIPSIPSLQNDEIDDEAITSRAIARKRNTFGQALGDILLPEGRTVSQLTEEALVKGLRQAGYKVVTEGEQGYETASPLRADVEKFWSWFTPGFATITLEFESAVRLIGVWPVDDGNSLIIGNAKVSGMYAAEAQWREVFTKGIESLTENLEKILSRPSVNPAKITLVPT